MSLEWSDEYCIDHGQVDTEHRRLLGLANNVLEMADSGHRGARFTDVVKALFRYTEYHFENEETLMERAGYPELEQHRAAHRKIIAEMTESIASFENLDDYAAHLSSFMLCWVVQHMMDEDKKIAPWVLALTAEPAEAT